MNWFNLYLITRLDSINCFSRVLCFVCAVVLFSTLWIGFIEINSGFSDEVKIWQIVKKIVMITIPFLLISALCCIFIPTTKEMAAIIIAPKVVNNEIIQEETKELYGYAKEYIKDLVSDKE